MKRPILGFASVLAIFSLAACSAGSPDGASGAAPSQRVVEYRVRNSVARADDLASGGFDLLEKRSGDDLFVLGDEQTADGLRALGFSATVEKEHRVPHWTAPALRPSNERLTPADANETYYGGYHTVNAHYSHLDNVASAHPDLAKVVSYGQSWRKSQGSGGYDLKAICITKQGGGDCALSASSSKPRFLLYTQIHAREITTGEISWRWIDYLVDNYASDPTVQSLLDSEEMWVVPIANPDGTDIVEQGGDNPYYQRKNADGANDPSGRCGLSASSQDGVDLNRNFGSHWGGASTSTNVCDQTYLGPKADSEIETTASEGLWRNLFPAVGGAGGSPAGAKGVMLTMHSDANVVMFPWYYSSSTHTPNDATQRAIASHLGQLTGYQSGQSGEVLYAASGSTDDWIYEQLGTSVFTIEVGDNGGAPNGEDCSGFFPPFACQSDYFWPKLQPALVYLAQKAAAPFAASE